MTLSITSNTATDATLFLALHDISADGTDTLPAQLVAPLYLSDLTPGVATTVTVRLPAIVDQVAAGHRLRLTVSTTDLAYTLPLDPRTYTIALAGGSAALSLPTVDGVVVRSGDPAAWLIVGVLAVVLVAGFGVVRSIRRRRRVAVDAEPRRRTGRDPRFGQGIQGRLPRRRRRDLQRRAGPGASDCSVRTGPARQRRCAC